MEGAQRLSQQIAVAQASLEAARTALQQSIDASVALAQSAVIEIGSRLEAHERTTAAADREQRTLIEQERLQRAEALAQLQQTVHSVAETARAVRLLAHVVDWEEGNCAFPPLVVLAGTHMARGYAAVQEVAAARQAAEEAVRRETAERTQRDELLAGEVQRAVQAARESALASANELAVRIQVRIP